MSTKPKNLRPGPRAGAENGHAGLEELRRPDMPHQEALGPWCLAVEGCRGSRLRYRGYCDRHGPPSTPLPPTRCQAPMRCYCQECTVDRGPACPLPPVSAVLQVVRDNGDRYRAERLAQSTRRWAP